MLITQTEEITAYLPTSVLENPMNLLSLTEDAEENYLVPVLGRTLYNKVEEIYEQLLGEGGGVLPALVAKKDETPEVVLVRLCQMPVIYFALANSTGLLSISLNDMGFNQASTGNFDAADIKSIERFERDAYFKARRGIDRLLIFLEEDARSKTPLFDKLWRESNYFYLQGDLLITTAIELNRFLNIDASREKFISLLPDIRYCQDTYLAPAIGDELIEAIVRSCTDATIIPTNPESVPTDTSIVSTSEQAARTWRKATDYLRMSLAIYVENRRPEKQRRYSENEAGMSLARAKEYITKHQNDFGEWIKTSPLYTPPKDAAAIKPMEPMFDCDDPSNAISIPFRYGLNRH